MRPHLRRYVLVALSFVGSAILLFSCEGRQPEDDASADEAMMTEYCENLTVLMSENGRKSYHFVTPLVEGYSLAKEPYREFRKGVKITTYQDDSVSVVDAILTANYAIYYENKQLWEAKGNVVVEKSDGKTLYTQQLFWNARTKRIYSNVDSKIVQGRGDDVFIGEGFESDESFKDWRFRRMTGRMKVEVTPTETSDSTGVEKPVAESKPTTSRQDDKRPTTSTSSVSKTSGGEIPSPQNAEPRRSLRPQITPEQRVHPRPKPILEPTDMTPLAETLDSE